MNIGNNFSAASYEAAESSERISGAVALTICKCGVVKELALGFMRGLAGKLDDEIETSGGKLVIENSPKIS
ncbi:MAG TPA: hypothetical protein VLN58_07945 [Verrucomicrobiae bacterium]|nr:hypothetical protein [Verrucomicrobiae bacterium]